MNLQSDPLDFNGAPPTPGRAPRVVSPLVV